MTQKSYLVVEYDPLTERETVLSEESMSFEDALIFASKIFGDGKLIEVVEE